VRIDFIKPYDGEALICNPMTRRVNLWPFGVGHFPKLNLHPNNSLIRGDGSQRIDHSDIGSLFSNIRILAIEGTTESNPLDPYGTHAIITGNKYSRDDGVHRYELWLNSKNGFPSKVISYNHQNEVIETVVMENLKVNIQLPEGFFNP
jgi:hypothetical protein